VRSSNGRVYRNSLLHKHVVESERLEFKLGWNKPIVLRTICAFANDIHNTDGGYIIIGIDEKDGCPILPPAGVTQKMVDKIQKQLVELGHTAIIPTYVPHLEPCVVDDKLVLVIWVPGGRDRPYRVNTTLKKGGEFAPYIRLGSCNVKAMGAELKELENFGALIPFDDRRNTNARISYLSKDLIVDHLRDIGSSLAAHHDIYSFEELLRRMDIFSGPQEMLVPINVGLMFFNPEPWQFFPGTQIDVVYFPDGRGGARFTEKEFKGPVHIMLRDALSHIYKIYITTTVVKYNDRAESKRIVNFPFKAVQEALANAVYHRRYDFRDPIEVTITPDELVVMSYPGPDRSVKIADLAQGRASPRHYRNRHIGSFLKEMKLTEGRGTGFPKIIEAMQENGSPPPEFRTDEYYSYFATVLPIHPDAKAASQSLHNIQLKGLQSISPKIVAVANTLVGEMTRRNLQNALGVTDSEHFRKSYIVPALKAGIIEMVYPEKPNTRNQRYRLTSKTMGAYSRNNSSVNSRSLSPKVAAVVAHMNGEMTRQAIQDALGLADRKHFHKEYLSAALESGVIEMVYPDKPNCKNQRYRLTSKIAISDSQDNP
jgi:ATP-dependent DNA helicase RecG